jgi:hypothetical protein
MLHDICTPGNASDSAATHYDDASTSMHDFTDQSTDAAGQVEILPSKGIPHVAPQCYMGLLTPPKEWVSRNHTYPLVCIAGINCPLPSATGVYEPPAYRVFDGDSHLNATNVPGVGAGAALPPANTIIRRCVCQCFGSLIIFKILINQPQKATLLEVMMTSPTFQPTLSRWSIKV